MFSPFTLLFLAPWSGHRIESTTPNLVVGDTRMTQLLELMAQLSVTIAALSAVAGAKTSGADEPNYLLRDVAVIGLAVALYSVLPLILLEADMELEYTLRVVSALAGASWFVGYVLYIRRIWGDKSKFVPAFYAALVLTVVGLSFFASTVYFATSIGHLAGLTCMLAVAGLNFIGGVFMHPPGST